MTVFVVMLVLGMLMAVGAFAARMSQLGVSNAGRARQAAQTHHLSQSGVLYSLSEIGRDPGVYKNSLADPLLPAPATPCKSIPRVPTRIDPPAKPNCIRLGYDAFQAVARTSTGNAGLQLMAPKSAGVEGHSNPGSLGAGNVRANFGVEVSDIAEMAPPAGFPMSGPSSHLRFYRVTVLSTGQVLPTLPDGTAIAPNSPQAATTRYSISQEETRAQVTIGPVP